MKISERNNERIFLVYIFCQLYKAHDAFRLTSAIAKRDPTTYKQAEGIADMANMLVKVKQAEPRDFMSDQNSSSNEAIEKYVELKDILDQLKGLLGCKGRDIIYKAVKRVYNKKVYCVEMAFYFTWMMEGFMLYLNDEISFESFKANYFVDISLFTGNKTPLKVRKVLKIANYILMEIDLQSVRAASVKRQKLNWSSIPAHSSRSLLATGREWLYSLP